MDNSSKLNEGQLIAERYRLKKYVGSGSFGEVWLATDIDLEIDVAIKMYISLDQTAQDEFKTEYRVAYGLQHENLLTAQYYGVWEHRPFLIMKYCSNGSAAGMLGIMPEKMIWHFIHDVAAGLAHLHGLNPPVIHQDIKPENILVDEKRTFLITDFGISKKMRSTMRKQSKRSIGSGALAYMGPERFKREPISVKASDIWALGVSIYEIATGELPFEGQGGGMLLAGAMLPELSADKWSANLNDAMQACLAKETWDRPTARQLADYAGRILRGRDISWSDFMARASRKSDEYDGDDSEDMEDLDPIPQAARTDDGDSRRTRRPEPRDSDSDGHERNARATVRNSSHSVPRYDEEPAEAPARTVPIDGGSQFGGSGGKTPDNGNGRHKSKGKLIAIIAGAVILIAAAVAAFLLNKGDSAGSDNNEVDTEAIVRRYERISDLCESNIRNADANSYTMLLEAAAELDSLRAYHMEYNFIDRDPKYDYSAIEADYNTKVDEIAGRYSDLGNRLLQGEEYPTAISYLHIATLLKPDGPAAERLVSVAGSTGVKALKMIVRRASVSGNTLTLHYDGLGNEDEDGVPLEITADGGGVSASVSQAVMLRAGHGQTLEIDLGQTFPEDADVSLDIKSRKYQIFNETISNR